MLRSHLTAVILSTAVLSFVPAGAGVVELSGTNGPGAFYYIAVPDGQDGDVWNGEVVYYTHGYTDPNLPLIPPPDGMGSIVKGIVISRGYGFAASSYSTNGYAVKEGIFQTHALKDIVEAEFGEPSRAYVAGFSMGGLVAAALPEKFPRQYDGTLTMCGIVGGTDMAWDYVIGARAAFDYYYPGALRGDAMNVPEDMDFGSEVVPALLGAVFSAPSGAAEMASIDELDIFADDFGEILDTIIVRHFFHTVGVPDMYGRTNCKSWYDNTTVVYSGTPDDSALNAGIGRFESDVSAENFANHVYTPSGRIGSPVLSVHNTRDPIVPITHSQAYGDVVAEAGNSDLLVRQSVDRYGHCNFTIGELAIAFDSLVAWVEDGVVPPSGDVTQP